jgi:F-type H+-transporting ATPase subunit gamma
MPGSKEIRTQIKSIKATQKITKAMEMVAASKIRKTQERQAASRPYAVKIRQVIGHLRLANPDYKHPFLHERPVKRVGMIIVSSDRGLCGGLNINLFRATLAEVKKYKEQGIEVDFCLIGSKAISFFRRFGGSVVAAVNHLPEQPPYRDKLTGPITVMLDAHREGRIDQLVIVANLFVNTMTQQPTPVQIVPVPVMDKDELQERWDYIYEPSASDLLDGVLTRYLEALVYQAVVENQACEQAARMVAMKNATENAGDIISNLQLVYNKARQAAITKELAEIVGGAAAV